MGARGYNIVQEGHLVPVLPPQNISGGVTGQIFNMKNAAKLNLIILWGALSAAPGTVQLFACTDINGSNSVAISFDRWTQAQAGPGNDVLGARVNVTAAGYTPSDVPNTMDVLEIQADQIAELAKATMPYAYVKLALADGTDTDYVAAVAILTGVRFQGESNQSATV